MSDRRYTYDEIRHMDQILYELAMYEVSGGMAQTHVDRQEMIDFIHKIDLKYNEFKRKIRCGEYTFEFIRDYIMLKNGAVKQQSKNMTVEEEVEDFLSQDFEALPDNNNTDPQDIMKGLNNFFDVFFCGLPAQTKSDDPNFNSSTVNQKSFPGFFTPPGLRKSDQYSDKTIDDKDTLVLPDDKKKLLAKNKKLEGGKDQEKISKKIPRKRTKKNDNLSNKKGGKNS
jgi:hypothetical protein